MNLKDYLPRLDRAELAALATTVDTQPIYLRHLSQGVGRPSMALALRLEQAKAGVLTARELHPDLPWPASPPADPAEWPKRR